MSMHKKPLTELERAALSAGEGGECEDSETMGLEDACNALAILMEQDRAERLSEGLPIFSFIEHLNAGETPAMALALVKNRYELPSLYFEENTDD